MTFLSLKRTVRTCTLSVYSIAVFAYLPAHAQLQSSNETKSISLESAIKRTLANAPYLHEFAFKQQALKGELKTAALKPELNASIELENFLGTGEVSGIKDTELTLSLSSVIEFGDKLQARSNFTSAKSQVIEAQKQIRTLDILAEVTRRYVDVLAQQALIEAYEEAQALAIYTYQSVAKRVEAGASPAFEQQRADAALARARLDVLTVKQTHVAMIKSLAIMWGEQAPRFTKVEGNLFALSPSPSLSVLFEQVAKSPNIDVFVQEYRLQEAQVRLAQSANQADLSWTAGIRRMNGIDETAFVAGVSMPLFASERNLGEYEQQKAVLGQLEQQREGAVLALYHQLNTALMARNNALLNVQTLQGEIIPPLEQALTLVEQAYLDGRFSYLEWVSTRQELLDAKQALIHSARQAHQRAADIESLTATPLSSTSATSAQSALPTSSVPNFQRVSK
ncbi:TolC family protein [Glaciecola sp. KUL10]|uniref:TolC family protein n=1 Tax=Glaciecola sp. (strain KUL10) TaxID=2161813 RepID=UPI000D789934|nr:TolC family protein [Glaciecola sp. KUL10]GBL02892.1 outer membrane efflux protein [Glaciecola sp. KUL10]